MQDSSEDAFASNHPRKDGKPDAEEHDGPQAPRPTPPPLATAATLPRLHPAITPPLQASAAPANSYMLLQYKYVPDILEKRGPFREQHLAGANKMVRSSTWSGACPTGGAVQHARRR